MKKLSLILLLLFILPSSLFAQEKIEFNLRLLNYGLPVTPVTHVVRPGQNNGNAIGLGLRAEGKLFVLDVWVSDTDIIWWEKGSEAGPNPGYADAGSYDAFFAGTTFGPKIDFGPATASLRGGAILFSCKYYDCGSSPMFSALLAGDVKFCFGDKFYVCGKVGVDVSPPRDGRFTALADLADHLRLTRENETHGDIWFPIYNYGIVGGIKVK